MTVLKKMVLSLAMVGSISGVAVASPIVVYEKPVDEFTSVSARYDVDADDGRAWIDVEKDDAEFETQRTTVREKVDGLSYDEESGDVVFQAAGQAPVVCATKSSFLGMTRFNATGNCSLDVSYETPSVDDGTRPMKEIFAKVTINPTSESSAISER